MDLVPEVIKNFAAVLELADAIAHAIVRRGEQHAAEHALFRFRRMGRQAVGGGAGIHTGGPLPPRLLQICAATATFTGN